MERDPTHVGGGGEVTVAAATPSANGEGILDEAAATALPSGILFVCSEVAESLDRPACSPLQDAWKEHSNSVGEGDDLRTYLRKSFFDYHRKLYENRRHPLGAANANVGRVAPAKSTRRRQSGRQPNRQGQHR